MGIFVLKNWQDKYGAVLDALACAQKERDARSGFIIDPLEGDTTLEWVLYERQKMLEITNQLRQENNLPPVSDEDILIAERQASGHCDYTRKFACYCTELGFGYKDLDI